MSVRACLLNLGWHTIDIFGRRSEPAGKYLLDLDDPSDRFTFVELLSITFHGKGYFASQPGTNDDFLSFMNYASEPLQCGLTNRV